MLRVSNIIVPCWKLPLGTVGKYGQISTTFLAKKHSSINTIIDHDGIHVAESETIANAFNSTFNSIPITLSDNINNNLTAFENYLTDQIPESDKFHQTSIHHSRDNENH